MKTLFTLLLVTATFFSASAQKIKDYNNPNLNSSGTHFSKSVTDSSWGNQNGKSYTKATFTSYSGDSYVILKPSENIDAHFAFDVQLKKGELDVVLAEENGTILHEKNFGESQKDIAIVSLEKGKTYHLKFIGNQAKGSYFSQWTEQ